MTDVDVKILQDKGISEEKFEEQLTRFRNGFPYMKVERPAVVSDAVSVLDDSERSECIDLWREYLSLDKKVVKFVPASGAASRMFKALFEFLERGKNELENETERKFFECLERFAFIDALNAKCKRNEGLDAVTLRERGRYLDVVKNLLDKKGLNYGSLPKGLLLFHAYEEGARTPFEEHFVEGALYAKNKKGEVNLHFTVSPEHMPFFQSLLKSKEESLSYRYGASFNVSFSVQNPSTDTVAVDEHNEPMRNSDGSLIFRPGGHGALIENLNAIDADIVFIKNIDNVSPDVFKQPTIENKVVLAGLLVKYQKTIFEYQSALENSTSISDDLLQKMLDFCQKKLCITNKFNLMETKADKIAYLKMVLNRPLRVCGMVKNEGEPGGGPYLCQNPNGTVSAQILESSQFDKSNEEQMAIFNGATHFNPVDLVCGVKNYKNEKYDLTKFVDPNTGFISMKSKNGKSLKALELPGLWNGAMSDWNTIFVEVPIETFSPVKMVTDLLRAEHQSIPLEEAIG